MKSLIGTGGREMRVARKGEERRVKEVGSRIIRRMVARRFEGAIERDERRRRWRIEEKIFSSKNIPFFLSERLRNLSVGRSGKIRMFQILLFGSDNFFSLNKVSIDSR